MHQPGATYETTRVSLRVDEASLSHSVQQPQITEPRAIPWSAFRHAATKAEHNFVFSVCFGSSTVRERLARVTVVCYQQMKRYSDVYGNKVQFDVILGNTQCLIENLVSPKDSLSILVAIAPAIGEANNAALQRSEKIYSFSLTIFIAPTNQGEMRTTVIMGQQMQLVPSLSASSAKPKRPRGRPPSKRAADEDDAAASPPRDGSNDDDDIVVVAPVAVPKIAEKSPKKRVHYTTDHTSMPFLGGGDDDAAAAAAGDRKRPRYVPETPQFPDEMFAAIQFARSSPIPSSALSISFSEIEKKSAEQQKKPSQHPKTPSPPRDSLIAAKAATPAVIVGQ